MNAHTIAALAMLAASCTEAHAQRTDTRTQTQPARRERAVFGTGSLVADQTIPLAFERPGTLRTLVAEVGAIIEARAVIATLDDDESRIALRRDRAAMDSERAALLRWSADRAQSRARIAIARRESARSERLFASGGAAELERDRSGDSLAIGELELSAISAQRPAIAARIAQARARAELTQRQIERDRLLAPVRARVLRSELAPGAFVAAGVPVVQLVPIGAEIASVWVHESELSALRVGARATLVLRDHDHTRYAGTVLRVRPEADPRTHEVRVDVRPATLPPFVVFGLRMDAEIERAP